ncbi:MAG TPA: NUDIX domain-containing protein [Ktedonobacteraceae bacterium]|nr:NUDIX domain-containing protein [Ktedonobacteraceae bacterium]
MDTIRTMITFKSGDVKFTYRVGGIAIHNDSVLFQTATENTSGPFYFLPGGRAELSEQATESLKREMLEELGVDITIERLLYVIENFFIDPYPHHELGLYFLISFPPDSYLYKESGPFIRIDETTPELPLIFEWLPRSQFAQSLIQPECLRDALQTIPDQTTHIVHTSQHR